MNVATIIFSARNMQIIKIINQTVAFLLELGMLAAVGHWGYLQGKTTLSKYGIALFLISVIVILWGYFAAPKSVNQLSLFFICSKSKFTKLKNDYIL